MSLCLCSCVCKKKKKSDSAEWTRWTTFLLRLSKAFYRSLVFFSLQLYKETDLVQRGDLLNFLQLNENQLCFRHMVCSEMWTWNLTLSLPFVSLSTQEFQCSKLLSYTWEAEIPSHMVVKAVPWSLKLQCYILLNSLEHIQWNINLTYFLHAISVQFQLLCVFSNSHASNRCIVLLYTWLHQKCLFFPILMLKRSRFIQLIYLLFCFLLIPESVSQTVISLSTCVFSENMVSAGSNSSSLGCKLMKQVWQVSPHEVFLNLP